MRFTITEPCIIEVQGSVTFTSIPEVVPSKVEDFVVGITAPEPIRHRKPGKPRHTLVCRGCGITFRGRKNQLFHDGSCKSSFYRRMLHPSEEALAIHAGATGVSVQNDVPR